MGEPTSMAQCPIGLACDGYVAKGYLMVSGKTYKLPASARRFVREFDAGKTVEPFTFELDRPLP